MIKTKITEKDKKEAYKSEKKIIRVCDTCGKEDSIKLDGYLRCHKYRKLEGDFCTSCAMKEYNKKNPRPIGKDNKRWRGGMSKGYKLFYFRDKDGKARHMPEHRHIYANFLKRELLKSEKIHHIDMDKINNSIDNLYLCDGERKHQLIHNSMESCGFELLNNKIWFNRNKYVYSLDVVENNDNFSQYFKGEYKTRNRKHGNLFYSLIYLPEEKKEKLLHIYISEQILGRKLFRDECVHHINGDTLNNNGDNLQVMTRSKHAMCHRSLQTCVAELYKQGIVGFNREIGKYFIV